MKSSALLCSLLLLEIAVITLCQEKSGILLAQEKPDILLAQEKSVCDEKLENANLDDEDRRFITDYHNEKRAAIASGDVDYIDDLRGVKNMYKLKYDCNMEKKVQEALAMPNPRITFSNGYGQNMAKFSNEAMKNVPRKQQLRIALESWYNPILYYGIGNSDGVYHDGRLYTFANMIYAKTLRIGCGYSKIKDDIYISCVYNLIGSYENSALYERGRKCKKHADCTTYAGSKCIMDTGLCNFIGRAPVPGEGENTMCRGNKGMSDHTRQKVLEEHNIRRSLLATGQVVNGPTKEKLATSAFMPKMIYDCKAEAEAISYSKTCSLTKSEEETRLGLGENIFIYPIPNVDPVIAFKAATESWWSQIDVGSINKNLIYDAPTEHSLVDVKAFTQMAWAKSARLGCATRTCYTSTFVVCRYSPAGNVPNGTIYTSGAVCSQCTPACNATEGLCNLY
ncbi:unnamed protein product [Cylicocyclus nassatus]|uniref:SCP domain-containing protein n=1 Tax=Cylicocyclus nassatus TaxID=53992 RepID=A0AA36DK52_CYLNA|nr:unnamed protein product [Cylicocyclus nassatus]